MPRRGMAGAQLSIWLTFSFRVICATSSWARLRYSAVLSGLIAMISSLRYFSGCGIEQAGRSANPAKAQNRKCFIGVLRRHADFDAVGRGFRLLEQHGRVAVGPASLPRVIQAGFTAIHRDKG